MTAEQLTALDAMIAAVEAGKWLTVEMVEIACAKWGTLIMASYDGSLDAAKALHEALLPGCSQYMIETDPTCICVKVAWWPDGLSGKREHSGVGWHEECPARAWLLAILCAYRATVTP